MTKLTIIKTKNGLQNILNEIRSTAVYNDKELNHREVSKLINDRTSGDKADVSYDLIEKCFVTQKKGGQENPIHFVPVDSLLDNSYFFKHFGTWLENGVTEDDINISGEIAGRLQNTLIVSVCNQDMDEKEFKNNFLN